MKEKRKKKFRFIRWILYVLGALLLIFILVYFIEPRWITDFLHIGIDRENITLKEKKEDPRQTLLNKWYSLDKERKLTGLYPPFSFTATELQIFIQEIYQKRFPPEVRGIDIKIDGSLVTVKVKVNLAGYEKEITDAGTPQIAEMLKEDIVFTVAGTVSGVEDNNVLVDIKSIHFGFIPLPIKLLDNIINSQRNIKKYGRVFDFTQYPLPKGVKTLKIENSIVYVNY